MMPRRRFEKKDEKSIGTYLRKKIIKALN